MSLDVMQHMLGDDPAKVFFGRDAVRIAGKLFVQDSGTSNGRQIHTVAGLLVGDLGIPTKSPDSPYRHAEMWGGEIILVPRERLRDIHDYFQGMGLTGALTCGFADPANYGLRVK